MTAAKSKVEACVKDIDLWMIKNKLKLNGDKTELVVLSAAHRPFSSEVSLNILGFDILSSSSARNIGVKLRVEEQDLVILLHSAARLLNDEESDEGDLEQNDELVRIVLAAKDKDFINDEAYHELRLWMEMAATKKIPDVLKYILSINSVADLLRKDQQRTICARFAADGRKTSAKIGSVMSVINLVDKDNANLFHHYTIALYNVEDCPIERFLTECSSLSTKKTTKERKGCIAEPLVPIPLNSVVIDTLHLFLRIMGLVVDKVLAYQEEDNLIKEMKLAGVPFKFFKVQGEGETTITKFTKLDDFVFDIEHLCDEEVVLFESAVENANGKCPVISARIIR
ncbi:hypothetical protein AC249_AIPGENE22813 [Exaiptasia diaphana]|nr:hypothetical protein AC249_AIPGENE22813 [Exaiptasia diaphana]